MSKKKGILSFPGEDGFTVKPAKSSGTHKNFISDAGTYIPVDNYTPTAAQQELGQTAYHQNVPPPILNVTNSGGESSSGGASVYHSSTTQPTDNVLSTAPVTTNAPASTTKVTVTATDGDKTTPIGSALVDGNASSSKKPFPWVPIVIGASIIVALIGVKLLFKKS